VNARQHDTLAKILSYEYAAKLAAQEPSEQEAVLFYGYLLDADGNKDSALVQFQKAIAIDSTQYPPWQQILMTFGERMQADSLISYGSRAAAIFPDNPVLYYFESVGYLLNKNYKDAVTALRLGLQNANPDDTSLIVQFHASLGDAYQELKDPGAADSSYQLALRLQPDNVTVLNNYSYFLSQQGVKLREAEQMSAKTIRARPEEGTFLDTYGWILYKQGRFKEAKKYLELALDHMELKGSGVTNEHLGDAEYKLGNPKKAMQYWMKAKATGGGSDMLDYKIKNGRLHD
jgi:Tfp pilus assembly protein PilF